MRANALRARPRRRGLPRTPGKRPRRRRRNVLDRQFSADRQTRKWGGISLTACPRNRQQLSFDTLAGVSPWRSRALRRSFGGLAQARLQLGEGVFDGVEAEAVGREIEKPRARRFNLLAPPWAPVARATATGRGCSSGDAAAGTLLRSVSPIGASSAVLAPREPGLSAALTAPCSPPERCASFLGAFPRLQTQHLRL
jgi:hypothetical protein